MSLVIKGDDALLARLPGITNPIGGDGYDWQSATVDKSAWTIPGSWGRDGWDLGDWPYVQYGYADVEATDTEPAAYGYISYCEGDISIEVFATREERDYRLDESALFHWKHSQRLREEVLNLPGIHACRVDGVPVMELKPEHLPKRMRGHFSWARLDKEKPLCKRS